MRLTDFECAATGEGAKGVSEVDSCQLRSVIKTATLMRGQLAAAQLAGHVPPAIIPGSRFDVSLTLFMERSYLNIVSNELH